MTAQPVTDGQLVKQPDLITSAPCYFDVAQIRSVEDAKHAIYIGSSAIPNGRGGWSEMPLDIFWQPIKHPDSQEFLFGIYHREGKVYIRGTNHFDGKVTGVFIPESNVLSYSIYVHDFFAPSDVVGGPRVCVDGGRDYFRVIGEPGTHKTAFIDLITRTYYLEEEDESNARSFHNIVSGVQGRTGVRYATERASTLEQITAARGD